ncbi:hypothetical protein Adt_19429 [Abeliophyllum distichum]|uniref:Uncharacterized protein n=1 Tax=Abeliophyllum distichum TaxID=126358 RepID=A0ABD1SSX5_9LAMI
MKSALNLENKNLDVGKKFWSYKLNEFPIFLQIWAYEIIYSLNDIICMGVGEGSVGPRLLNWEADYYRSQWDKDIFDVLIFRANNFKPTDKEKFEVHASRLFEKNQAASEFNVDYANPQSNPIGAFDGASTSRSFTGEK